MSNHVLGRSDLLKPCSGSLAGSSQALFGKGQIFSNPILRRSDLLKPYSETVGSSQTHVQQVRNRRFQQLYQERRASWNPRGATVIKRTKLELHKRELQRSKIVTTVSVSLRLPRRHGSPRGGPCRTPGHLWAVGTWSPAPLLYNQPCEPWKLEESFRKL